MKNKYIFITSDEWFESTPLRNPIVTHDYEMETRFPNLYRMSYDTRLLATTVPTEAEKSFPGYNNYRETYGTKDIRALDKAVSQSSGRTVFLNGLSQELFAYIAPLIQDTCEVLYLFKCPKIKDLSLLSRFSNLQCVHLFWNPGLTSLWDMKDNSQLKVLSFSALSKLSNIDGLRDSAVEYIHFDSLSNDGRKKVALFDLEVFDCIPYLKYLSLDFSNCNIHQQRKGWFFP